MNLGLGQHGRPPSRTSTPGGVMVHGSSPSMPNRAPMMGVGVGGMQQGGGGVNGQGQPGQPGMMGPPPSSPGALNAELMNIPMANVMQLQSDLGMNPRDLGALSVQEKAQVVELWRAKTKAGGMGSMVRPPSRQMRQQGQKRNSTSPGEEHETLPGASPPANKKMRRSPADVGMGVGGMGVGVGVGGVISGSPYGHGGPGGSHPPPQGHAAQLGMMMRANGVHTGPPPPGGPQQQQQQQPQGGPPGQGQGQGHMMMGQPMGGIGMHPSPNMQQLHVGIPLWAV